MELDLLSDERYEKEFSHVKDFVYLDHAGATLYAQSQLRDVFQELETCFFANPHSLHLAGNVTSNRIEAVRARVLSLFNANEEYYSLAFTSGATSALKLVADIMVPGRSLIFAYFSESHTSVVGMREIVRQAGGYSKAVSYDEVEKCRQDFRKSDRHPSDEGDQQICLFAFPAQCNFSGFKFPLEWIDDIHNGCLDSIILRRMSVSEKKRLKWLVLLDAATYVGFNELHLGVHRPDFVTLSFYKMFGYPTGLGAVIVRKAIEELTTSTYFGGGNVQFVAPGDDEVVYRNTFHERFESGTSPFLTIISLEKSIEAWLRLTGGIKIVSKYAHNICKYAHDKLLGLLHPNGKSLVEIYTRGLFGDFSQGNIIAFNLKTSEEKYIGYSQVARVMDYHKIMMRTGCFCNVGCCETYLNQTTQQRRKFHELGHVCGDFIDLIEGHPTGCCRVSMGYMTRKKDIDKFIQIIRAYFLSTSNEHLFSNPPLSLHKGTLLRLLLYPIKSCAAITPQSWELGPEGLKYDRQWFITNSSGNILTQKQEPRLSLITPEINLEKGTLKLCFPGHSPCSLQLTQPEGPTGPESRLCGDKVSGTNCGPDVALWLDRVLKTVGTRLYSISSRKTKKCGGTKNASNQAKFLLLSSHSLEWFVSRMDNPIPQEDLLERFRPNLVVSGNFAPFSEESWHHIHIGAVAFTAVNRCQRCDIIRVNQKTASVSDHVWLELLRIRKTPHFGVYFNSDSSVAGSIISTDSDVVVMN